MKIKSKSGIAALITGASAGIGLELAKIHASKGGNLVLVARRKERLEKLKVEFEEKYKVDVTILIKDLSLNGSAKEIFNDLKAKKISIDYLINNAGFSRVGYFHELGWEEQQKMIMLNVHAMVELAYLFIPEMVKRKSGRILNVASSAAFAPGGPLQTIYYATKAFLVSFSQGVAGELEGTDVTCTVLCPGATATEFEQVSGLDKTRLFSMEKVFTAGKVAKDGYNAMLRGELVKLTALSPMNKFVLKNMNLFPAKRILEQIKMRQEIS